MKHKCPICGYETIEIKGHNEVEFRGVKRTIKNCFSRCENCEMEFADTDQMTRNKLELIKFRSMVNRTLGPETNEVKYHV